MKPLSCTSKVAQLNTKSLLHWKSLRTAKTLISATKLQLSRVYEDILSANGALKGKETTAQLQKTPDNSVQGSPPTSCLAHSTRISFFPVSEVEVKSAEDLTQKSPRVPVIHQWHLYTMNKRKYRQHEDKEYMHKRIGLRVC